jgi:YVTN family beta-propeller protein
VAVSPDGSTAYVANMNSNTVSVIDTATNTVTATIPASGAPYWVAVSPDGSTAYVTEMNSNAVSVIDTATNAVTATIAVGLNPFQVAVSPAGANQGTGYVTNFDGTLSVLTEPAPPADPPTDLATTPGDGQVGLSWTAPSSGSDPITDYLVEVSDDGGSTWASFAHSPSTTTTATVTGLTNGTAYTFRVSAINSAGTGPATAASSSVTPRAGQTITFTAPSTGTVGGTQALSATASSGLTVAFAIDPASTSGACTLAGTRVTFTGAGSCVLDADQSGSAAYFAAPRVQQSITVAAAPTPAPTPSPSPSPTSAPHATVALSNPTPNAQDREMFSVSGLQPGSTATFTLHSKPYLLGTAIVDSTGTARLTVALPAGFIGAHTIVVQGIAADGTTLTLRQPITIRSTDTDTDTNPGGTGLAATGVSDLTALLGSALGLLITGLAVLLLGGRRCRATHTH